MTHEYRKQKYVQDLKKWELPDLDAAADRIVRELCKHTFTIKIDEDHLADQVYKRVRALLTKLPEAVANEAIHIWLAGGAAARGPSGDLEMPFLEGRPALKPLTAHYCVENTDGTRTVVHEFDLGDVVARTLEATEGHSAVSRHRHSAVAKELRALADRLDRSLR